MPVAAKPPRSRSARPPQPRGTVSPTSAQRFAARVRARRRRRVLIVVLVLVVLAAGAWAALRSPWATVQRIEVTGTDRVPVAVVRAEADGELGHPMLLARTTDIATRLRQQRLIRSVRVQRHWPGVLRIQVHEREPVAALPSGAGELALVDDDGIVIETVAAGAAPAGMPRLEVGLGAAEVDSLRGCLAVLHGLPTSLTDRLVSIGAATPDGIWLKLSGGVRVEWGDSDQTPRKAAVLTALLPQKAVHYDVRSPDTPAVRGK